MKQTLRAGLEGIYRYRVPETRTVPRIYEDAPDFQMMPAVLATGYLVALAEWACIELVKPHLDWPGEQTLGTRVDLTHVAATPPGQNWTCSNAASSNSRTCRATRSRSARASKRLRDASSPFRSPRATTTSSSAKAGTSAT